MPNKIQGRIIRVTESGNLVSDISAQQLIEVPTDDRVTIRCDEHETIRIFQAEHSELPMTLIAVVGSSGQLELEIVGDSARLMLGISVGEKIEVEWT